MKEEAAAVLAAMGLTVSDAVRLLLTKVAQEKALPFAPLVPNAVTVEAMREARRGAPLCGAEGFGAHSAPGGLLLPCARGSATQSPDGRAYHATVTAAPR